MKTKHPLMIVLALVGLCVGAFGQSLFPETKKKAEAGDASAQTKVGVMYLKGEGVSRDYKEAVRWFGKAAVQGDAEAHARPRARDSGWQAREVMAYMVLVIASA